MVSEDFKLPTELNTPEFWRRSYVEWKNITKYDIHYISTTLTAKKSEAHIAYRRDIENMMQATKLKPRMQQMLAACKKVLKNTSNNKGNVFFWETEVERTLKLAVASSIAEQTVRATRQKSEANVLRKLSSHQSNPLLGSSSTDGITSDDVASTMRKRSAEKNQPESAKRSRIQDPILVQPVLHR